MHKNLRESPEKITLVSSENKRNQTKLVNIMERQGSMRTTLKFHELMRILSILIEIHS